METQELIKLLAATAGVACIAFGILALFRGLRADGIVDISALFEGKIKTGSAGVLLLFFGVALFAVVVLKGYSYEFERNQQTNPDSKNTNTTERFKKNLGHKSDDSEKPKSWWQFWQRDG